MVPTRFFSRKTLAAAVAAGLLLVGIWQATAFRAFLASLDRPAAADLPSHSDAIVSLAGGSGRLERGLDLMLEGKADVLLLSGTGRGATIGDIFPERNLGDLAGKVILLENRSTSTYENAIEAWAALTARGEVHDIVLLTSNYHMLRSEYVFRRVFPPEVRIHSFPIATDGVSQGKWLRDGRARKVVVMEYMKYLWYRLRY